MASRAHHPLQELPERAFTVLGKALLTSGRRFSAEIVHTW
jgi:hypothetical protein